jgi:hypothetical protein
MAESVLPNWVCTKEEKKLFAAALGFGATAFVLSEKEMTEEFVGAKRKGRKHIRQIALQHNNLYKYFIPQANNPSLISFLFFYCCVSHLVLATVGGASAGKLLAKSKINF